MSGVNLLAPFPAAYDAVGVKTSLQHVKSGPCIVLYNRSVWDRWDAPFWQDDGVHCIRPRQPDAPSSCPLCGQGVACLNGGPGALALWQGPAAAAILTAFEAADEELLLAMAWHRFAADAPLSAVSEYDGLAEHIASDSFRGFRRLNRGYAIHMDWQDSSYAQTHLRPDWTYSPITRERHLPFLLAMLADLGVRVPGSPVVEREPTAAEMARAGAIRITESVAADRAKLTADLARAAAARWKPVAPRYPDPPPPMPAEELAEALMGYDHAAGETRPWGPFGRQRDMRGHNSGASSEIVDASSANAQGELL